MIELVAALIWENEKIMICQRPKKVSRGLLWEFVGCKVEPWEKPEKRLVRECKEALDVTVAVEDAVAEVTQDYLDFVVHLTVFNAKIVQGTPKKLQHNDIRWIAPEESSQYEFCPSDQVILEKLREVEARK